MRLLEITAICLSSVLTGCCHGGTGTEGYNGMEISKLAGSPAGMEGRRVEMTGTLDNAGANYFTDLRPVLRDGRGNEIPVAAWLPLSVPPPRPGANAVSRPRLMSDLLGKRVRLSGVWEKTDSGHMLRVEKDELIKEE